MKRRHILIAAILACAVSAEACWEAPPPIEWIPSSDGSHLLMRDNEHGRVAVYRRGDRERKLWSADIDGFDDLFSRLIIANDGRHVLHVRGNHLVDELDQVVVELFGADGSVFRVSAAQITTGLRNGDRGYSTNPRWQWLQSVVSNGEQVSVVGIYAGLVAFSFDDPEGTLCIRRGEKIVDRSWYTAGQGPLAPTPLPVEGEQRWLPRRATDCVAVMGPGRLMRMADRAVVVWAYGEDDVLVAYPEHGQRQSVQLRDARDLDDLLARSESGQADGAGEDG